MKSPLTSLILVAALAAGARAGENVMDNGDLSADKPGFTTVWGKESVDWRFIEGKPAPPGKRCLEIEIKQAPQERQMYYLGYQGSILVDPSRKYRVRVKALVGEPCLVTCGGYAQADRSGKSIPTADGKGTWEYTFMHVKETTDGWEGFETTIGPRGSDCKYIWQPETFSISMIVRFSGEPGKFWLSDFAVEEF